MQKWLHAYDSSEMAVVRVRATVFRDPFQMPVSSHTFLTLSQRLMRVYASNPGGGMISSYFLGKNYSFETSPTSNFSSLRNVRKIHLSDYYFQMSIPKERCLSPLSFGVYPHHRDLPSSLCCFRIMYLRVGQIFEHWITGTNFPLCKMLCFRLVCCGWRTEKWCGLHRSFRTGPHKQLRTDSHRLLFSLDFYSLSRRWVCFHLSKLDHSAHCAHAVQDPRCAAFNFYYRKSKTSYLQMHWQS